MKASVVFLASVLAATAALAQPNFPNRRAYIVNICPHVQLSNFFYENKFDGRATRFRQNLMWKNIGTQPLVAFEVVVLKYDPFDRRMIGSRWIVGGNSADWTPLLPGETSGDGTIGYGDEEVFTAVAYVRAARLEDGTVWTANEGTLINELRKLGTGIRDFGDVKPDPKPAKE